MKKYILKMKNKILCKNAVSITYNNKKYLIIVNGECYNLHEIYKLLSKKYSLNESLEEIVFFAYQNWKFNIYSNLEGAYSFIIGCDDELYAFRDPFGLTQIYYTNYNDYIWISNTIDMLLTQSNRPPVLDSNGILELFAFGPSCSEDKTLFSNIYSIPIGSYLTIKNEKQYIKQYYHIPTYPHTDDFDTTLQKVHELLIHSIHQQSTDCKASFLSGGLDSSIIHAVCAYKKEWNTYSLDYIGNKESFIKNRYQVSLDNDYIQEMLNKYPSLHTSFAISQEKLASLLEDAMLATNQPGMADIDSSLLWLCQQVQKEQKNILSGECSDEIFGGYPWFYRNELKNLETFPWLQSTSQRIQLLKKDIQKLPYEKYIQQQYNNTIKNIHYLDSDTEDDKNYRIHAILCIHWFMQTLIRRQVTMSNHANLTIRTPFANLHLIEYVYNIPWDMKFYNNQEKGILRKAFENELPHNICWRKKNPYPKTHNPKYASIISSMLQNRYNDSNSPLHELLDEKKWRELMDTNGSSFTLPWYGQLMSGPQLLAYLYQIDRWICNYHITIRK